MKNSYVGQNYNLFVSDSSDFPILILLFIKLAQILFKFGNVLWSPKLHLLHKLKCIHVVHLGQLSYATLSWFIVQDALIYPPVSMIQHSLARNTSMFFKWSPSQQCQNCFLN